VHLILLGMLFLSHKGDYEQERFAMNSMDNLQATVVFMPLKKHVTPQQIKNDSPEVASKEKTRSLMSLDTYQKKIKKQNLKKEVKKEITKKVVEKIVEPKKIVTAIEKKVEIAAVKQNNTKQPANKLIVEKKVAVQEKKEVIKQPEIEKIEVISKGVDPIEKPIVEIQEKIEIEKESVRIDESELVAELVQDAIDPELVSFIGRKDLDLLQIKELIHTQVALYYKPPVGISKKAICELKVLVGADGKAEKVTVFKSSGSMANDLCARAALLQVTFPKEVIGKEIIIELGQ